MSDKDWEMLVVLYEEGTITNAAKKLYISQPSLTYRIKQLEKYFKVKILHRGNKGVIFTAQGELLVKYAKEMITKLSYTKDHIINIDDEIKGVLKIGGSSNFALYQLPSILEGFVEEYPNIEINLTTGWSSEILQMMQNEVFHIAILRGEHAWKEESLILNEENLCVVSKSPLKIDDLPSMNYIRYQTDTHLRSTFDAWWRNRFSAPPNISMEVDRIETCKELVKRGLGYSLIPSISLRKEDELFTINLEDEGTEIKRKTWLLYREELMELKMVNVLVDYIKEYYRKNV